MLSKRVCLTIGLICLFVGGIFYAHVYYFAPAAQKHYDDLFKQLKGLTTCSQLQLFDKNINYLTSNDYAQIALHEKVIEKSKEVCK